MKLAIVGSRNIGDFDIKSYLPEGIVEIVSGGARGVDRLAANYAEQNGIILTEILPDYAHYGKSAPLKRNEEIAAYADQAIAFWDGHSRGTAHVIRMFRALEKPVTVIFVP